MRQAAPDVDLVKDLKAVNKAQQEHAGNDSSQDSITFSHDKPSERENENKAG